MHVSRGQVYRAQVAFPSPRPAKPKRVVVLRSSDHRETDVPVVICSTDHHASYRPRAYEVKCAPAAGNGLNAHTKIDCRWVYTLGKSTLGVPLGSLPPAVMEEIAEALVEGLQL